MKEQKKQTTFAQDSDGDRYVCVFNDSKDHSHDYDKLNKEERSHCRPIEFPWN